MSATLNDIAQHAAVSVSTVSRVLNDQGNVSLEARARVLEAVKTLGYRKRARQTAGDGAVLLLIRQEAAQTNQDGSLAIEMERLLLAGIQPVLRAQGLAQRIVYTKMAAQEDEALLAEQPDIVGVIMVGGIVNRDYLALLQTKRIPFVVAGAHVRPLQASCVMPDFHQGMVQLVEHLAQRGRRRIGFVNGPPATTTSQEKYLGLRLGLALHGLDYEESRIVSGCFSFESGDRLTRSLLEQHPDLDAIVYGDDHMAIGGLRALRSLGRSIPDDVAVAGCYDYEIARYTEPPLTSISFDKARIGALAARRLCSLLAEPDDQEWFLLLPTALAIRAST
jgi:LacI family transcriptional regulator